jgi:hypothetical protein
MNAMEPDQTTVDCAVCGRALRAVTNSHLATHGLTVADYRSRFMKPLASSASRLARTRFRGNVDRIGLGTKPDSVIARETGMNRHTIKRWREERGISAFAGLLLNQEGQPCRSVYEGMYDAYLHWQGIDHQHEVWVTDLPYRADFLVGDRYVEIAGMRAFGRYEQKHMRKIAAYTNANVLVTWYSPGDVEELYTDCPIPLRFSIRRACRDCGRVTYDLVKGRCRGSCYMRYWRERGECERICTKCEAVLTVNGSDPRRFCSRECYARSLEFDWPSWEWIDDQLTVKSAHSLAIELGVKPSALYMRLRRRREREPSLRTRKD